MGNVGSSTFLEPKLKVRLFLASAASALTTFLNISNLLFCSFKQLEFPLKYFRISLKM